MRMRGFARTSELITYYYYLPDDVIIQNIINFINNYFLKNLIDNFL